MGLGRFLGVDWSLACSDSELTSTLHQHLYHHHLVNWPHLSVPIRVSRLRGWSIIISLLVPWVCLLCQHASMPACQHARSVPACHRVIPEVSELPWMLSEVLDCLKAKTWCHCARWLKISQDCTYGAISFWNDDICIVLLLMWWPIGCVYHHLLFIVFQSIYSLVRLGFVMEDTV